MFLLIFAQFGKYIFNVSSVMNTYFLCVTVNKNFPLIIYFTSVYVAPSQFKFTDGTFVRLKSEKKTFSLCNSKYL